MVQSSKILTDKINDGLSYSPEVSSFNCINAIGYDLSLYYCIPFNMFYLTPSKVSGVSWVMNLLLLFF